jgi:Holliday junction DNA helicase RuvA
MIGYLRGTLAAKKAPSLLLDVRGVGYEIDAPMSTFFKLPAVGEEVHLYTHLAVREDAHALYGFLTESERALFRSLIKVTGVGARLALGVLSGVSVEEFHRCVQMNDAAMLVRLPGIGKKTAERLIIEMRDRLPATDGAAFVHSGASSPAPAPASSTEDAVVALIALGFKPPEAAAMIRALPADGHTGEELLRLALRGAGKK